MRINLDCIWRTSDARFSRIISQCLQKIYIVLSILYSVREGAATTVLTRFGKGHHNALLLKETGLVQQGLMLNPKGCRFTALSEVLGAMIPVELSILISSCFHGYFEMDAWLP